MKEKHIHTKIVMIILIFTAIISGCSILSPPNLKKQEETAIEEQKAEIGEKSGTEYEKISTADIKDIEGMKSYILPETIWNITGMTAEEQAKSFWAENPGNYYFTDIVVNEDNALVLTMTEKQKNMYMEEVILYLNNNIKGAYEKEDIQIKSNENYREVKMILGEESDSAGFQGTFVKVISYMAVYQILNGCEPEEWDIHLIVEREEEIILDADIPDDKWVLTNEDFGE